MKMKTQDSFYLIIKDIEKQYIKYRKLGRTRAEAIELIRQEYARELQDADDRLAVLIRLSLALCKKKELIESIRNYCNSYPNGYPQLLEYAQDLFDRITDMPKDD